jgi:hypothetical protein
MQKTKRIKGTAYPHEYLWRASTRSLNMAKANEKERYYLLMQSLLTSYLAFEAFINYLGECLDPDVWKDERSFFNQANYYGIEGKVKRLAERLPSFALKKGEKPYQAIMEVRKFRNLLVHGKPYYFKKTREIANDDPEIDMFEFNWDEFISLESVEKSRSAIKDFSESLRSQAQTISGDLHLCHKAFEGPLAHSEGETT